MVMQASRYQVRLELRVGIDSHDDKYSEDDKYSDERLVFVRADFSEATMLWMVYIHPESYRVEPG
jgi:hypothetical protein